MCDPATIGLILTATGAGTQAVNNNIALRRQDEANAEGIRRQGALQRDANTRVNEQIDGLAASTGETERAEALEGFRNALRASKDSTLGALPGNAAVGQANPRFAEMVSEGAKKIGTQANDQAGRLSVIDGAVAQRLNEGARTGRTATDLNEIGRQSSADDFITRLRVAERRPNEFVNALGATLQGAGSAVGLNGLPDFLSKVRAPNLTKLAKAGTLIDSPSTLSPFSAAVRHV